MTRGLTDLFDRCELNETERAYFEQGQVRSLAISADKKTMICQVGFNEIVPISSLSQIEKNIAKTYNINRMRISPRYTLDTLTKPYIDTLKERVLMEIPSACGLLADSKWTVNNNALEISMSESAKEHLKIQIHKMSERIHAETGLDIKVNAVEIDDDTAKKLLETQNEDREQTLKKASQNLNTKPIEHKKNEKQAKPSDNKTYHRQKVQKVSDEDLIYGKLYSERTIAIRDAMNEHGQVTIEGEIFLVDHREISSKKTGKEWVKIAFDITDNTNSVRVSKFLSKHNYELVPIDCPQNFARGIDMPEAVRLYPHIVRGEGQFVALLKKHEENFCEANKSLKLKQDKKSNEILKNFIDFDKNTYEYNKKSYIVKDLSMIKTDVRYVSIGVEAGVLKADRFEPAHNLFTSFGKDCLQKIDLDYRDKKVPSYLKGEEVECTLPDGYGCVLVNGISLGGFKISAGKFKNHYPKGLRNYKY